MRRRARLLIALATGLPLLLSGGTAAAASACERLQGELANLPRVVADTAAARKYASAVARQNIQLRKAKSDLRRLGCSSGSVIVFGGANAKACDTLTTVIGKMERNLQVLEAKRREFAAGSSAHAKRTRLLAALDANGCTAATAKVMPATTTETLRTLTDERTSLPLGTMPEGGEKLRLRSLGGGSGHGNLRTVCVRTCDGGFFPISSGATPLDFRRDQKVCAMMCPRTETELYYHSLSGAQDAAEMISTVTGRPYAEMPNAFSYRTRDLSKPGACGCDLSAYYQEMIRREKALSGKETGAERTASAGPDREETGSVTTIRTTAGESRPTTDTSEGAQLDPAPERKVEERAYDPTTRKVRTVGPLFLPDEESAIDLGRPPDAGMN